MKVKRLELINFRNYKSLKVDFYNGFNYIVGDNAKGKTNLVEAIYALSFAKSFRATQNEEMINREALFATIRADIESGDAKKEIEIQFKKEGKKILLNKKSVSKLSELAEVINVLSFIPKDTLLLKDSPRQRRNFLNQTISKFNKSYLYLLINYEKLLKERNDALKDINLNFNLIDVLTRQMIKLSKEIYLIRKRFIDELNKHLTFVYNKVSLSEEKLLIKYKTFIDDSETYEEKALKMFEASLQNDIKRKMTTYGIQKEDFEMYLDERNVALYGSQGENRMVVIALKLAPYFLVHNEDKLPVIILDDVLSELDKKREENLLIFLKQLNQVFVTNTKKSEFCENNYFICKDNNIKKE